MANPVLADPQVEQCLTNYLSNDGDPYSAAVAVIAHTLELVLGDHHNGSMSQGEFDTLEALAFKLCEADRGVELSPYAG